MLFFSAGNVCGIYLDNMAARSRKSDQKKSRHVFFNEQLLEGFRADVVVVYPQKDKKLLMLKQLVMALVKGLNSNTAAVIKKVAGLVSDFLKRPNLDSSPGRAAVEEAALTSMARGVQMLGQIKHGSCHPHAI